MCIKYLLIIMFLSPYFLNAQTTPIDPAYFANGDTTTTFKIKAAGNINFDTIRIANNSIQTFAYDLKALPNSVAHLQVTVNNINGVYSILVMPNERYVNFTSVGQLNSFSINKVGNLIIVQYKAASGNKTVMDWTLTKTKIGT